MYLHYAQVACTNVVKTASDAGWGTIPAEATHVELQCAASAGGINYTMDDVTVPGDQRGMYLAAAHPPKLFTITDFKRIKFVSVDAASSHLHAHFIGRQT